jgi:hypothetical protein
VFDWYLRYYPLVAEYLIGPALLLDCGSEVPINLLDLARRILSGALQRQKLEEILI